MRIVAIADTHMSSWNPPEKLLWLIEEADLVIHAGDFVSYEVYKKLSDYNLIAVRGNSDDEKIKSELQEVQKFRIGGLSFGLIHKGNFINEFHDLIYKAMELEVDVLVFGHLHRFVLEKRKGRIVLCPGSPTQPRMSVASCAEIEVEGRNISIKHHVIKPVFCSMEVKCFEDCNWK